jgi:alanine-synthesizing transaminase
VRLLPYRLTREADFRIDLDDLRRAVDLRTKAIVLVHPNNPTGSFVRKEEARQLFDLARERGLALIVDEVFGEHALDPAPADAVPTFAALFGPEDAPPLSFVLSGLSKVLLLPQAKLGWTVVGGPDELVAEALARLEFIADTFLSVSTPVQLALPALLPHRAALAQALGARLRQNLAALDAALAACGSDAPVRRLPVHGGWYATLEVARVHDEDTWVDLLLREDGVIVHPGYFFDFDRDGFLVVSLLPPPDVFADAVARMVRRLSMV